MIAARRIAAAVAVLAAPLVAQRPAFVELELSLPRERPAFVGQRVVATLRFGIERGFRRDHLVQPFRRALDVPVALHAPWLDAPGLDGLEVVTLSPSRDADVVTTVVAGAVAPATPLPDDPRAAEFAVFAVRHALLPQRSGRFVLVAPELRYTYATEFDEDFLNGRVPRDPSEDAVRGAPRVLPVVEPPQAGRPAAFRGAVGPFTLAAATDRAAAEVGETVELTLTVTRGDGGNLRSVRAPNLDDLRGFHVLGRLELPADGEDTRRFRYDLAPLTAELEAIPAIALPYLDPGPPPRYATTRSQPVPLAVRGPAVAPDDATGTAETAPDTGDAATDPTPGGDTEPLADISGQLDLQRPDAPRHASPAPAWIVLLLLAPWLVAAALVVRRQRHGRATQRAAHAAAIAARRRRRHDALAAVDAAADDAQQAWHTLLAFLAVHLECSPAAAVGDDLPERLRHAGVPAELAESTARWLRQRVAARYGGRPETSPDPTEAAALAHRLQPHLDAGATTAGEEAGG